MKAKYVKTPTSITYNSIVDKDFTLSSSQYRNLIINNKNCLLVQDFLSRKLNRKDLGIEVGAINYIDKSPYLFLRTKALQEHSFIPEFTDESALPIMPSVFSPMNLKKNDILISKDSNIGEVVILDKDYPNVMLSGAIYKLPIKIHKYYLLAFIKHPIFREQLDAIVPKGATIRHAKTLFLNCKIPLPNLEKEKTIEFIECLTKAIINKEILIRERHSSILGLIEKELLENQKMANKFSFQLPKIGEIENIGRLDTSLYCESFKKWQFIVRNYLGGYKNLIDRGFCWARGTSLEKNFIGNRIDSNIYMKGFYELILPTNISQYGYVEQSSYIGTQTKLKTISQGDIIFGGEGFGKGRTYVVIENSNNVATNYHGIRIINKLKDLTDSIFVRCFLAFWREKGMIDYIGVGGSGGHCAPAYFNLIDTPLFTDLKKEEIVNLYHNPKVKYNTEQFSVRNFLEKDNEYNANAGIYELDKTAKKLKEKLNRAIDDIINDRKVEINFNI